MFEQPFFAHRKMNREKLLSFGFAEHAGQYRYTTAVMDGQFKLLVCIAPDGEVSTRLTDPATGEEYLLYKIASSVGAYVGTVRSACEAVLTEISECCYEPDVFVGAQTAELIRLVRERFGDELEFLWEKFPDCAIWRRPDSRKWYGLLMTISLRKLGLDSDETAEVINLRFPPDHMAEIVDHKTCFPGWHMNKKTWYTALLGDAIPTAEIGRRLDISYRLAR